MIVQKDALEPVIRRSKKSGKTVVAGGPYPTSSHERSERIDHFVLNEAEVTLPHFLAAFERNRSRIAPRWTDSQPMDEGGRDLDRGSGASRNVRSARGGA